MIPACRALALSIALPLTASASCGAGQEVVVPATGSGSTIEIEWLEAPTTDPAETSSAAAHAADPAPPVPTTPELGDGSWASEMVAGAVRLLGLEVDDAVFVAHCLAGALLAADALGPSPLPAVGALARAPGLTAVVETTDGDLVHLIGLRGGRVERWTRHARGLAFARPAP